MAKKKERPASTDDAGRMRHLGPIGYSMTPGWVVREARTSVWLYDWLRARYGGFDEMFPGIDTLAKDLTVSKRTVQNALAGLKAVGAVEVVPRFREDGGQTTNEFITHFYEPGHPSRPEAPERP
ncbi:MULTISPECIES: helix-turn-helix domain-containing protein [unclassified Streptomyces]|uniref:helix-turn-helix domain-containing protein n=1 Tax=unclassified Streptomyces TaxID=2593676 RepID=UPI002E10BA26|nr:helix-turn-helix domain-containing protein [Streptomyces sp. NBC_01244]